MGGDLVVRAPRLTGAPPCDEHRADGGFGETALPSGHPPISDPSLENKFLRGLWADKPVVLQLWKRDGWSCALGVTV
jgi:hypothetical protein